MTATDAEILNRLRDGPHDAFELLVRRYRAALVRVAYSKLNDAERAEDVVQETLLAAFSARGTYNPQYAFRTWLWTILLNRCRRHLRRRARRPREIPHTQIEARGGGVASEPSVEDAALSSLLSEERWRHLHALLAELPEPQADALRLRFFGGLKFSEIAQTMKCSVGGARLRVKSGLAVLARRLRETEGNAR